MTNETTSATEAMVQRTTDGGVVRRRARGGRWAASVLSTLVALGGVAGVGAASAQADDPVFDFVPEGTYVRALDAAGNDVTQAGERPDRLKVRFEFPTVSSGAPVESVRNVDAVMPEGLQGNPEAVARCPLATLRKSGSLCPAASQVGTYSFQSLTSRGAPYVWLDQKLYNIEPPEGVTARFAVDIAGLAMQLDLRVSSDGSYRIVSRTRGISQTQQLIWFEANLWGVPAAKNGSGAPLVPLLTMGSQCGVASSASLRASTWKTPSEWVEANLPFPALTGCDRLQFRPSMDVRPVSDVADAPSGYRFQLRSPQNVAPNALGTPPLKRAEIVFPEGTAISPGGANGLVGCSDGQAAIGVDTSPDCPSASRIGSVTIDTPVLDVPLKGGVFLGTPKSQDAQSGEMFRIFLLASAKGVDIKQEGKLFPDPVTGRLRAVFEHAPQQPFDTLTVELDGGPGAALVNPSSCGTHTASATMESWGGQTATSESSFEIDCRPGLGAFVPSFTAGSVSLLAGVSSPFNLSMQKPDGQSPLSGLSLRLPKGLLANLKGNLGQVVGSVRAFAGSGAAPYQLPGTVTLEGPYGDAPFSLQVVVPAKAGPFDLGDVVIKQKLYVDPNDASVTVVSDPIPTILQGVPTRIQRLDVSVDKPGFMVNPTSCEGMAIGGTLGSSSGQSAGVNVRFQVGGCADLKYAPKLDLRIGGSAKELRNGGHPQLDATLLPKQGEANQRKAQVTLPLNLALDPDNAKALCEPAQAASNRCPQESIVGKASAVSILDVPLEGPVYFVRGERTTSTGRTVATLPKLYVPLSGQGVTINVHASSSVVGRKLQTTFDNLPDAPIERFDLSINGGSNGILKVTNGDVCKSTSTPRVGQLLVGQNGRTFRTSSVLETGCRTAIVKTATSGTRVAVTVGGLPTQRAKVTASGAGLARESRTLGGSNTVATIKPRLNAASRRALRAGRSVRVRVTVTVKPTAKGSKATTVTRTVTVKPARK